MKNRWLAYGADGSISRQQAGIDVLLKVKWPLVRCFQSMRRNKYLTGNSLNCKNISIRQGRIRWLQQSRQRDDIQGEVPVYCPLLHVD